MIKRTYHTSWKTYDKATENNDYTENSQTFSVTSLFPCSAEFLSN